MIWSLSWRADPRARALADRHYNRQKVGASGFMPPGRCLVLRAGNVALWGTSWPFAEFTKHAWAGAWICSVFRREGGAAASDMIRDAVAATRWRYGTPPDLGMVTFLDRSQVRPIMRRGVPVWGWTWLRAGFFEVGETQGGLMALQLLPDMMPEPEAPLGAVGRLFG